MPLFDLNRQPTHRQLRQFGLVCLVALPLVGWIWGGGWVTIGLFAGIGLVLTTCGLVAPRVLLPVFVGASVITIPIGLVVGELTLLLIYFVLFLPLGLVFRLMGRDPLERTLDRSSATYWRLKKQPEHAARYYRQS